MIINNFIVFEGIDGAGTTTQLKKLKEVFSEDELEITAEPTSLETGKFLRRLLKGEFEADPKTAAFLFAADRCEHIWGKGGVYEKCESGKIVVSDRYIFSSLAYQGVSAGTALPEKLNEDFLFILAAVGISAEDFIGERHSAALTKLHFVFHIHFT